MPTYKFLAAEIDGTEQNYETEVALTGANTVFVPTSATTNRPANPAIEVQTAIANAQGINNTTFVSSTTSFSNAAAAFTIDPSMTIVPPAGTYIIFFSSACETTGVNVEAYVELFVSGVAIDESLREIRISTAVLGIINLSTNSIAAPCNITTRRSFNGTTDTLTVRTRVAAGAGNIVLGPRSLVLLQTSLT